MSDLPRLADLLRSRNTVENNISTLIGLPATIQNVGEYLASVIFGIALEESAKRRGSDGRFTRGPLAGYTVDVQWHIKHDGQFNIRPEALPDFFLILSGPRASSMAARGLASPWVIETIYLFDARELLNALRERGVQVGSGTSVTGPLWERAEIYPQQVNTRINIPDEAHALLARFR